MKFLRTLLALTAGLLPGLASAQFGKATLPKVTVSLVSETKTIVPGQPFTVGLKMVHPEAVHSYWINPGTGSPTQVKWELPAGFSAGPLLWAMPHHEASVIGVNHQYEGAIVHLFDITPPKDLAAGVEVTLKAQADWQECDSKGCIQQKGTYTLALKSGAAPEIDAAVKAAFDETRAAQPVPVKEWQVAIEDKAPDFTLTLTPGEGASADPGEVYFFESTQELDLSEPPVPAKADGKITIKFKRNEGSTGRISGFLHAPNGWLKTGGPKAMALPEKSAAATTATRALPAPAAPPPVDAKPAPPAEPPPAKPVSHLDFTAQEAIEVLKTPGQPMYVGLDGKVEKPLTVVSALVFAFLGGLLLNLMPCVFPVVGLKVLGFVKLGGGEPAKIRNHSLVFAGGLILSLLALAGLLMSLRAAGQSLGWGFQQQSPAFTGFICLLLFVMGLNLCGLFEIGTSLTSVGGELQDKGGYSGSFFSGVLTTLIATPCSGPFVGAAMGFTLRQPAPLALLLFFVFGFGIAFPYVVLAFAPGLIHKLPKPGAWMETFKKFMAFPLFAAVLFFSHSFAAQAGMGGLFLLLIAFLLAALGCWIYGHWGSFYRPAGTRRTASLIALVGIGLAVWAGWEGSREESELAAANKEVSKLESTIRQMVTDGAKLPDAPADAVKASDGKIKWEPFSPRRVKELRDKGRIVFLDFTAEWCATCKTNEKVSFNSPIAGKVRERFKELDVVGMKVDFTDKDPIPTEILKAFDRDIIPVYVVYRKDKTQPPVLFEDIITPGQILQALDMAAK